MFLSKQRPWLNDALKIFYTTYKKKKCGKIKSGINLYELTNYYFSCFAENIKYLEFLSVPLSSLYSQLIINKYNVYYKKGQYYQ